MLDKHDAVTLLSQPQLNSILNTTCFFNLVGFDIKMGLHTTTTPPHPTQHKLNFHHKEPQINISIKDNNNNKNNFNNYDNNKNNTNNNNKTKQP